MKRYAPAVVGLLAGLLATGAAQAFPDRPVSIIVPWAAGGGTDSVVRTFAAGFQEELGVAVNVINRPGGNGVTGHSAIVNAEPDGYTLGAASPEIALYETLGTADISLADLDLFSRLAIIPAGVTVAENSPFETLEELLEAVEAEPAGTYSSSGTGMGGSWHVAVGGLLSAAGIDPTKVKWVPSQGGAPALMEVMSGGITMFTGSPVEALSLLEADRVRALAVMLDERSETFPDVPTVKEAIGKDWTYANWFALVAPKGIDPDARTTLYDAAARANARPEVQAALKERGITPVWDEPGEFDAFATQFAEQAEAVLKDLGLARN
ncbi:tripartite tricarboxylate transporter substrate binding protein [Aurantimonas sp. A2-1-M11]|uniref:Bug family tripartite tricarboxylate transporter substrate binding protein n=1 Tax=Aurantimonas sp. A2-1-M11 TaxID=3113712 RepID=UPI002F944353